jgi:hypothetical protein
MQLLVDLLAFVLPGLFSCGLFYFLSPSLPPYYVVVILVVVACSAYLAWAIWTFTDRSTEDMKRAAATKTMNPGAKDSKRVDPTTPHESAVDEP